MEEYEYDVERVLAAIEKYLGFIGPSVEVYEAQDMDSSRTGQPTATVAVESLTRSFYIYPFEEAIPAVGGPRTTMLWAVDEHFGGGETEEIGGYRRLIDALVAVAGPLATAHVEEQYAYDPSWQAVAVFPDSYL